MPEDFNFDINITLSDSAPGWFPHKIPPSPSPEGFSEPDEFDLDAKYGIEYTDPGGEPGNEVWASGIFGITCGNTCGITCGNTCQVIATCTCTCGNTCGVTCGNTCQVIATCTCTCGNTCGITCGNTCGITCGAGCDAWPADDDDDGDDDG